MPLCVNCGNVVGEGWPICPRCKGKMSATAKPKPATKQPASAPGTRRTIV